MVTRGVQIVPVTSPRDTCRLNVNVLPHPNFLFKIDCSVIPNTLIHYQSVGFLDHTISHRSSFERFAASTVYSITFDMRVLAGEEWQLQTSHECLENFTITGQVGAWTVDLFPSLDNLTAPLTSWKKTAGTWYQM